MFAVRYDLEKKYTFNESLILKPEYWTILDSTPFLCSSIVSFWITLALSITVLGNTGTPEMFQYSPTGA